MWPKRHFTELCALNYARGKKRENVKITKRSDFCLFKGKKIVFALVRLENCACAKRRARTLKIAAARESRRFLKIENLLHHSERAQLFDETLHNLRIVKRLIMKMRKFFSYFKFFSHSTPSNSQVNLFYELDSSSSFGVGANVLFTLAKKIRHASTAVINGIAFKVVAGDMRSSRCCAWFIILSTHSTFN